ncbi:helix-turn-helix transcriptional regulator [bacterium]|nr:helix-turn-helix transcriptional regulator [bacterium]
MDIKVLIGRRIKAIRKSRGLTQEKLCELIGIEPQSMSYIETGKFAPAPDTLQKLSDVLKVKPYEFYYFDKISDDEMEKILTDAIKNDKKLLKILYNVYKSLEYSV